MIRTRFMAILFVGVFAAAVTQADSVATSPSSVVRVGHWVEIRGRFVDAGTFEAEEVEIVQPQEYDVLIGEAASGSGGTFRLLDRRVVPDRRTRWRSVDASAVVGRRVKVEGYSTQGSERFVAAKVSSRGPGRERIAGRVERLRQTAEGVRAVVLGFEVLLPASVGHDEPLERMALAPPRARAFGSAGNEDDLFGRGILLARTLRLLGQVEAGYASERELDLDPDDAEDRDDLAGSLRLRLEWDVGTRVSAVVEGRYSGLERDDDEDGRSTTTDSRLGETFIYAEDTFAEGFDAQLGRQDFDEPREWIYDQNLDAIRLVADRPRWRLELSTSATLTEGSERDMQSRNYIAYLATKSLRPNLAAWAMYRDIDVEIPEKNLYMGLRALGDWLPDNEGWLELALFEGSTPTTDLSGWAFDVGSTWTPGWLDPLSLTLGYAFGSGDRTEGSRDSTFRQTGFQDNNAKFDGVTSFRYYGELMDPELANLTIATAGIGARMAPRTSLDLVFHRYRQDEATPRLINAEIDRRPDGIHRDLGWELDLILGSRNWADWDLEVVGAYFSPGAAFDDSEPATLWKVQIRYRF